MAYPDHFLVYQFFDSDIYIYDIYIYMYTYYTWFILILYVTLYIILYLHISIWSSSPRCQSSPWPWAGWQGCLGLGFWREFMVTLGFD